MHNPAVPMDFEKYAKFKPNIEGFLKRIGRKAHYGLQFRGSSQTDVTKLGPATSVAGAEVDYDDETEFVNLDWPHRAHLSWPHLKGH